MKPNDSGCLDTVRFYELIDYHDNRSCSYQWRGILWGDEPRYLVAGLRGRYGFSAREIAWCLEHDHDIIPDGMWLYRLCDRPRCIDPAHLFIGPGGLGRTLGAMLKAGWPVELMIVKGFWDKDSPLLLDWKRSLRRRAMAKWRKSLQ